MKKMLALALSAAAVFALAGCGEQPSGSITQKVAESPSKQDFQPLTEIKDGQKNIYVVGKAMNDSYWKALFRGVKKSAEEDNVNVYLGGVLNDGNWEVQRDLVKELDGKKVDAVILGAADSVNMSEVARQLREKHIPVILVDTPLSTEDYDAGFMTDNLAAGAEAANQMVALLKDSGVKEDEKATVVMAVSNMQSSALSERLDSAVAHWHNVAPKDWTISPQYLVNYGDKSRAEELASAAIDNVQDLKGFIAVSNGSTRGTLDAVTKAGRKDIAVVGFDRSKQMSDALKDGSYHVAAIAQHEYKMGYEAVKAAEKAMDGTEITEKDVDTGYVVLDKEHLK